MKTASIIFSLALLISVTVRAQTKKDQGSQQPTKSALVKDVKKYITKEQKHNQGYFNVYDSVDQKPLKLKLTKVHSDKFSYLGNDTYFDCANFKGKNDSLYDIDIFMKWDGKKFTSTTKRKVHKVNGKARYYWYKDGNVWKTKPANEKLKKGQKKSEHPAH